MSKHLPLPRYDAFVAVRSPVQHETPGGACSHPSRAFEAPMTPHACMPTGYDGLQGPLHDAARFPSDGLVLARAIPGACTERHRARASLVCRCSGRASLQAIAPSNLDRGDAMTVNWRDGRGMVWRCFILAPPHWAPGAALGGRAGSRCFSVFVGQALSETATGEHPK